MNVVEGSIARETLLDLPQDYTAMGLGVGKTSVACTGLQDQVACVLVGALNCNALAEEVARQVIEDEAAAPDFATADYASLKAYRVMSQDGRLLSQEGYFEGRRGHLCMVGDSDRMKSMTRAHRSHCHCWRCHPGDVHGKERVCGWPLERKNVRSRWSLRPS